MEARLIALEDRLRQTEEVLVAERLKLFITCSSMINLSSLRLDNSIQFLDTSSIRIGLKLVLLNLGSNVSENLLFFAFQGES